jgi:uroporphyrin-III C-methyltransferase/precorrin-2 dehydrogenase/sirohydrochlorin ferrochelatase
VAGLVAHGKPLSTPVAVIENAGRAQSRHVAGRLHELPALAAERGRGPALIVVGEIAAAHAAVSLAPSRVLRTGT